MSTELQAAELLEKAAENLETSGWCRFSLWLDGDDGSSTSHCAIGSMLAVSGLDQVSRWAEVVHDWKKAPAPKLALTNFAETVNPGNWKSNWDRVAKWNNENERTADEVIDTMKLVAKDLRNKAVPA